MNACKYGTFTIIIIIIDITYLYTYFTLFQIIEVCGSNRKVLSFDGNMSQEYIVDTKDLFSLGSAVAPTKYTQRWRKALALLIIHIIHGPLILLQRPKRARERSLGKRGACPNTM